jgi:hypothetical protein
MEATRRKAISDVLLDPFSEVARYIRICTMHFGWCYSLEEIIFSDDLSSSQLEGQHCGKTSSLPVTGW